MWWIRWFYICSKLQDSQSSMFMCITETKHRFLGLNHSYHHRQELQFFPIFRVLNTVASLQNNAKKFKGVSWQLFGKDVNNNSSCSRFKELNQVKTIFSWVVESGYRLNMICSQQLNSEYPLNKWVGSSLIYIFQLDFLNYMDFDAHE